MLLGKQAPDGQEPPSVGTPAGTLRGKAPVPAVLGQVWRPTGQKGEAQAKGKEDARELPAALRAAWQSHPTLAGLPTHAGSTLGYLRWRVEPWAISQGSPALLEKPRASVLF